SRFPGPSRERSSNLQGRNGSRPLAQCELDGCELKGGFVGHGPFRLLRDPMVGVIGRGGSRRAVICRFSSPPPSRRVGSRQPELRLDFKPWHIESLRSSGAVPDRQRQDGTTAPKAGTSGRIGGNSGRTPPGATGSKAPKAATGR